MQCDLEAQQFGGAGGAEVDGGCGVFGDGVDAGSAVDGAEVQRGARLFGQRGFGQSGERGGQGGDGVGCACVSKAVAAGAGDGDLKAAAAEGLGDGGVGACAVEDDVGGDAAGERSLIVKVTHAAQIAFALFAHVGEDDEGSGEFNFGLDERVRRWPACRRRRRRCRRLRERRGGCCR